MTEEKKTQTNDVIQGANALTDTVKSFQLTEDLTVKITKVTNKQLLSIIKLIGTRINEIMPYLATIPDEEQAAGLHIMSGISTVLEPEDLDNLVNILARIDEPAEYDFETTVNFIEAWLSVNTIEGLKKTVSPILQTLMPKAEK